MFLEAKAVAVALSLAVPAPTVTSIRTSDTAELDAEGSPIEEARNEYDEGSAAYELGRYEEAVGHFERSFELSRRKELLFNLGQAYARWYEVSGDPEHLRRARRLFDNYRGSLDQRVGNDQRARTDAQQRIDAIDVELVRLEKESDAANQPRTDGRKDKPLYKKGWFWGTIVGVVVVGAAATTVGILVARRNKRRFDPELGTIGEMRATPGAGVMLRF